MKYGPQPLLLSSLAPEDFPETMVSIVLQDGSTCRFRNAFYHREADWIAVYSEHGSYHMFLLTSIASIRGAVREDDDKFAFL